MKKNNLNTFMSTSSVDERNQFLAYCVNHGVVPAQKSFESFSISVLQRSRMLKVAQNLIKENDIGIIGELIRWVKGLKDELIMCGDSEGFDTRTQLVRDVENWLKENIEGD